MYTECPDSECRAAVHAKRSVTPAVPLPACNLSIAAAGKSLRLQGAAPAPALDAAASQGPSPSRAGRVDFLLDCAPPTAEPQQRLSKTVGRAQEGMADGGAWLKEGQSARLWCPAALTAARCCGWR